MNTLVHLSDLHFGHSERGERIAGSMVDRLIEQNVGHVVVTGDVTHRGREEEYERFLDAFAPLLRRNRLTVIPGNHDRGGDDVADSIMHGRRVQIAVRPGLFVVMVDSTGPHNRHAFRGHGMITPDDLREIEAALQEAPPDHIVALLMHHHPYPLPEESPIELLSNWVGLPYTSELNAGAAVLQTVRGRCDLVLHGHRHIPRARVFDRDPARPLMVYNAGSTTELAEARLFTHDAGSMRAPPRWLRVPRPASGRVQASAPSWLPSSVHARVG